jgi:type III pantothenate kinase
VNRVVADLGNSRLKCARLAADGSLGNTLALPIDDPDSWLKTLREHGLAAADSRWAVASVNPPAAAALSRLLDRLGIADVRLFPTGTEVPVRHTLDRLERAGVDRALAVWEAVHRQPPGRPGHVVLCGSALVVERITADGVWRGGAIAPGLRLAARALNLLTAMLPLVEPGTDPPPWGSETEDAMAAGVFWGAVGTIQELLDRQTDNTSDPPWVVWSGGDAPALAPHVRFGRPLIVPNLVLEGLARLAFGASDPG